MPMPIFSSFIAGDEGEWTIDSVRTVRGEGLPRAACLDVVEDQGNATPCTWRLQGTTSNLRYTNRQEAGELAAIQEGLGRPQAREAAMIPIRKTEAWWALSQDDRRSIMAEQSRHIAIGLDYLPAIARRPYHSRDLGQPFDFVTWFEFAPEHRPEFEHMVERLRATVEWTYVDREVDLRLSRRLPAA